MAAWAKGIEFKDNSGSKVLGGVGLYGDGTASQKVYLGYGDNYWSTGVTVSKTTFTFNGRKVYHEGAKPTASEIGAAASSHSHNNYALSEQNCSNKNFNDIKTTGFYYGYTGMTNAAFQGICVLEVIKYSPDWVVQRQTHIGNLLTYERHFSSATTWSPWRKIYNSQNKPTPSEIGACEHRLLGNETINETFKKTGIFGTNLTANANFNNGYPVSEAGMLISGMSAHDKTNLIYTTYGTNRMFICGSGNMNDGRTAWAEVYSTANPPRAIAFDNKVYVDIDKDVKLLKDRRSKSIYKIDDYDIVNSNKGEFIVDTTKYDKGNLPDTVEMDMNKFAITLLEEIKTLKKEIKELKK